MLGLPANPNSECVKSKMSMEVTDPRMMTTFQVNDIEITAKQRMSVILGRSEDLEYLMKNF